MNKAKKRTKKPTKASKETVTIIEHVDPKTLRIFPGADIVPRPTPGERAELLEDVAKTGMKDALDVIDDEVVDGLTRLDVALELGLEIVPIRQIKLGDGETPIAWAIKKAKIRRRLTDEQVAMLAVELAELNPEPRGGSHQGQSHPRGVGIEGKYPALAKAAKALHIPVSKAVKARKLRKRNRVVADKVKTGERTMRQARQEIRKIEEEKAVASGAATPPPVDYSKLDRLSRKTKLLELNTAFENHRPQLYRILNDTVWALGEKLIPYPFAPEFRWVDDLEIFGGQIRAAGGAGSPVNPPPMSPASAAASQAASPPAPGHLPAPGLASGAAAVTGPAQVSAPASAYGAAPVRTPSLLSPAPAASTDPGPVPDPVPRPRAVPFPTPPAAPASGAAPFPVPKSAQTPIPGAYGLPVDDIETDPVDEEDLDEAAGDEDGAEREGA